MKTKYNPSRVLKTAALALAFAFPQVGLIAESVDTPDQLIGGPPIDGRQDWYRSAWFGDYNTALAPWILHIDHGFIYCFPGSTSASIYFYDIRMDAWWWTKKGVYPYIYVFDPNEDSDGTDIGSAWLRCVGGVTTPPGCFKVMTGEYAGEELYFAHFAP